MSASFRMGCSGSGDLITADELFEILIMILPEADVIKNAFMKWISLPDGMRAAIETRLRHLTSTETVIPSTLKELHAHKGYSMSQILLRVFREWDHIQDTLGAPGIQSGFTALPKRLEMDITFMMKCLQEVLEFVIRQKSDTRHHFFSKFKAHPNGNGDGTSSEKPVLSHVSEIRAGGGGVDAHEHRLLNRPRISFSETTMTSGGRGDHNANKEQSDEFLNSDIFFNNRFTTRGANKKATVSDDDEDEEEMESSESDDDSDTEVESAEEAEEEGGEGFYQPDCDDCDCDPTLTGIGTGSGSGYFRIAPTATTAVVLGPSNDTDTEDRLDDDGILQGAKSD